MNNNNLNIKKLYEQLSNEISNLDYNRICNICKLNTNDYDRITLNCGHIYHTDCLNISNKTNIINCHYCNSKNNINKYTCKYIDYDNPDYKCNKKCINDCSICKVHTNKIIKNIKNNDMKINKLEKEKLIILNSLEEKKKLFNVKSSEPHICNFKLKNKDCYCTNKTKDDNFYCKIHMNSLKKNIFTLEKKIDNLEIKIKNNINKNTNLNELLKIE